MRTEAERAAASAAEENVDTATSYLRSVAGNNPGRGGYGLETILSVLATYQRTNDETYASFVSRYLSPQEIVSEWKAAIANNEQAERVRRKRRRS